MPALGKITAIRVQDLARHIWFNWNDPPRSWDSAPSVTAGTNMLYVAFWVVNNGTIGVLTLRLVDASTGNILTYIGLQVAAGAGVGIEWTGNMPSSNYTLRCEVTP